MEYFSKFQKKESVSIFLVFILSFFFYLFVLTRYSLIYGGDGPYYLIQVRNLLEKGSLEYEDSPLSFILFTFFTRILNNDITLGIKFTVALFSALTTIPFYFWVKSVTNSQLAGYVSMFACTFSSPHLRLIRDILKNAVGTFFLLCFIYYLHQIIVRDKDNRSIIFAIMSLILTFSTHILDFGVALVFLIIYPFFALLLNVNKRKNLIQNAIILIVIFGFIGVIIYQVYPKTFSRFFYLIFRFFEDLDDIGNYDAVLRLFSNPSDYGFFIIPTLIFGLAMSIYEFKKSENEKTFAILSVTIIGLLLSFPIIPLEWLWRFLLMEFIPIAFIVGYGLSKVEKKKLYQLTLFSFLLLLILQSVVYSRTMFPHIQEKDYQEIELIAEFVPSNSVIITNYPYRYWIQYITRNDIAKNVSHELWNDYKHILYLQDKKTSRLLPFDNSTKIIEISRFVLFELSQTM